jgi:radical SAM protein with 4Fe4S-binding SPASM domain
MPPTWARAPSYVLWEVTLRCNLRCAHCLASAGGARADELTTDEALGVCDELAALGAGGVCLMGGELFLRRDWETLAERLVQKGISTGIFTNGWLLTEERADRLLDLGVIQVGVSLDAADPHVHDQIRGMPGAHARALAAMERVARRPFRYRTVVTSVNRMNIGELDSLRDLLVERAPGFTWTVNITSCHDADRLGQGRTLGREEYRRLAAFVAENRPELRGRLNLTAADDLGYFSTRFPDLHDFEWKGCRAGLDALGIESDGSVKGCLALPSSFCEGNVREKPLRELWLDPQRFAYTRRFSADKLAGDCRGCEHGLVCRGGCTDLAVSFTGSLHHHPFCLYREEREALR